MLVEEGGREQELVALDAGLVSTLGVCQEERGGGKEDWLSQRSPEGKNRFGSGLLSSLVKGEE